MSVSQRIDVALVSQGKARSRGQAKDLIDAGYVRVDGRTVSKVSQKIQSSQQIEVVANDWHHLVSRGGAKLLNLLEAYPPLQSEISGSSVVDLGACTGGFTQVLLQHSADQVHAVDVGHDQLHADLVADDRVHNLEGIHVKDLTLAHLGGQADMVVGDLSFISLTQVLPVINQIIRPGALVALLVKPQFEVGKRQLGSSGVVSDPKLWQSALEGVLAAAGQHLHLQVIVPCVVAGSTGNREFFCVWRHLETPAPQVYEYADAVAESIQTMKAVVL